MSAYEIIRPSTAFPLRQREKRENNPQHRKFIASLPCIICGKWGCEAAHLRVSNAAYSKSESGMLRKPGDKWTLPLCHPHHMDQHAAGDEVAWYASNGIQDPFGLCLDLFAVSGDETRALLIIEGVRKSARREVLQSIPENEVTR